MWKYFSNIVHRLTAQPDDAGMRPDPYQFQGGTVSIEAFTDPARLPAPQAAALIDTVISGRPDAAQLRQSLMARLQPEMEPTAPASTHWQDRVASTPTSGRSL